LTPFLRSLLFIPFLFGLFSVPAPLFDLLAGSSAGFFALISRLFILKVEIYSCP
jgi:hypothetical protein